MSIFRLKRSFTAGELSPLMYAAVDLERFKHGCKTLLNAYAKPQGPAVRRSGTYFVADITDLTSVGDIISYRMVDFIFSELQAYVLIFIGGLLKTEVFFASGDGLIEDPLIPGEPYVLEIDHTTFDFDANTFDYAQYKDVLFIAQGSQAPLQIARLDHDDWTVSEVVFVDPPTGWTGPDDWPQKVSFYEQRAVWARTVTQPQTIWFSKTGSFFDFGISSPLEDTDAIEATIASGRHNQIQWIKTGSMLAVGTTGDEWTVGGTAYEPLSYRTISIKRQSAQGGEALRPLAVGPAILYLERLGRVVNEFMYSSDLGGYGSSDLSILSPHLTEEYSIVRWAYQQTPSSLVWGIRSDGCLLALTYQREHKIIGWSFNSTAGDFLDVQSIPNPDVLEDTVWFLTRRLIDGENLIYLERMTPEFLSKEVTDSFFVDCGLEYRDPGFPITTITGLDHLEGRTVSILADGAVRPDQVVLDGQITLQAEASIIQVGLAYASRVIPLAIDPNLQDGTAVGRHSRITNIVIMLYRSLGLWYGKDLDHMEELAFRLPEDFTGQGVPLFTGNKKVDFPEGYTDEPTIILEQRQPLPMCVLAIVDESEIYT